MDTGGAYDRDKSIKTVIYMKQILLVILAAVLISVIIPLAVVELVPPGGDAASTLPAPTDAPASDTAAELM